MEKNLQDAVWIDQKGRKVAIYTMSNKWLNNIKQKVKDPVKVAPVLSEIERRKAKNIQLTPPQL